MTKPTLQELLAGTDIKVSEPCNCECHTPGQNVMHVAPCCQFTYVKVSGRHQNQETVDVVSSLINRF